MQFGSRAEDVLMLKCVHIMLNFFLLCLVKSTITRHENLCLFFCLIPFGHASARGGTMFDEEAPLTAVNMVIPISSGRLPVSSQL